MMLLCDTSLFITIADSALPTAVRARIAPTLLHARVGLVDIAAHTHASYSQTDLARHGNKVTL